MTETTEAPKHKLRNKYFSYTLSGVSQVAVVVKNLSANAGDIRDVGLIHGLGRSRGGHSDHSSILAWRIPHGQRSLAGYSPWGRKESDTTEHAHS